MAGGDDLGSDDEYLFEGGLIDTENRGTALSSDDESDINSGSASRSEVRSPNKRKAEEGATSSKKRTKKVPTNSKSVLIQAGRGIALDSPEAQVTFLDSIYSHATKLAESLESTGESEKDESQFSFASCIYSSKQVVDEKTKQFQHSNLAAFIKSGPLPSNKRLKNWKHAKSPMILIVTLSARRSVELMKQLSSLKLPCAKLFAKHKQLEQQAEMLDDGVSNSGNKKRLYSIAVGTPGRLLKLLRHESDGERDTGALRLNHTELVVIDTQLDSKGYNVCTLNDTSRDMMEFLREGFVPQQKSKKRSCKLALF